MCIRVKQGFSISQNPAIKIIIYKKKKARKLFLGRFVIEITVFSLPAKAFP
jgi:hypothetical protein